MSKEEELLDDLFDSAKSTAHYITGILKDLAEERYSLDQIGVDIETLEEMTGATVSILSEIRDLYQLGRLEDEDITEELPIFLRQTEVDQVWDHYGEKNGNQIRTA